MMLSFKELFLNDGYRRTPGKLKEIYSLNFLPYIIEGMLVTSKGNYTYTHEIKSGNFQKGYYWVENNQLLGHEWDIRIIVKRVCWHEYINPQNITGPGLVEKYEDTTCLYLYRVL